MVLKENKIKYCWNSALSSEGLQHSLIHPLRHAGKPWAPVIGWLWWGVTYGVHRAWSQVPDSLGSTPASSSSSCVPTGIRLSFSGSLFSICNIGMVLLPLSHGGIVRITQVVYRTLRTVPRESPVCPVVGRCTFIAESLGSEQYLAPSRSSTGVLCLEMRTRSPSLTGTDITCQIVTREMKVQLGNARPGDWGCSLREVFWVNLW